MSDATISECGRYRYRLRRDWRDMFADGQTATFIMLNPSTADANEDDATIRKCVGFAKQWGCTAIEVVNLFAFRATDPRDLRAADDPVGPDNLSHTISLLEWTCGTTGPVVAAWGTHAKHADTAKIGEVIRAHAKLFDITLQCLGTNADGSPRHPLMLAYSTPLEPWPELLPFAVDRVPTGHCIHCGQPVRGGQICPRSPAPLALFCVEWLLDSDASQPP